MAVSRLVPTCVASYAFALAGGILPAQNGALDFDGIQDAVDLPNPMATARQAFTWEAWVRPGPAPSGGPIYRHRAHYRDKTLSVAHESAGRCTVALHFLEGVAGGAVGETIASATVTFQPGSWLHVAGSFDGESMRVFVNGVERAIENASRHQGYISWTEDFYGAYIGANNREKSEHFMGAIDEVRAWDFARSAELIAADMGRRVVGPRPGLLGAWNLDDGEGQVAADSSGRGKHGRLGDTTAPDPYDPVWLAAGAPLSYVEILEIRPQPCPTSGSRVEVVGILFVGDAGDTKVRLGGTEVAPVALSGESIVLDAPAHDDGDVTLEVENGWGLAIRTFRYGSAFTRGDVNADGALNIADPVKILYFLFSGTATIDCDDAADANDDGTVNIADAVSLLGYLFLGMNRPPEPFVAPGGDGTSDGLFCSR